MELEAGVDLAGVDSLRRRERERVMVTEKVEGGECSRNRGGEPSHLA
jgi:hypothetical protein